MKLYKVSINVELMVLAEDEGQAERAVLDQDFDWSDEIRSGSAYARECLEERDCTGPGSLPWVADDCREEAEALGELTCAQLLARGKGGAP